jgi:hypothetical protein
MCVCVCVCVCIYIYMQHLRPFTANVAPAIALLQGTRQRKRKGERVSERESESEREREREGTVLREKSHAPHELDRCNQLQALPPSAYVSIRQHTSANVSIEKSRAPHEPTVAISTPSSAPPPKIKTKCLHRCILIRRCILPWELGVEGVITNVSVCACVFRMPSCSSSFCFLCV